VKCALTPHRKIRSLAIISYVILFSPYFLHHFFAENETDYARACRGLPFLVRDGSFYMCFRWGYRMASPNTVYILACGMEIGAAMTAVSRDYSISIWNWKTSQVVSDQVSYASLRLH